MSVTLRPFTREEYHDFWRRYVPDPIMDPRPYRYQQEHVECSFRYDQTRRDWYPVFGIFTEDGHAVGSLSLKRIDRQKSQCDEIQGVVYGAEAVVVCDGKGKIDGGHPNGNCGLVEKLFSFHKHDEHIQQNCCRGQNDLTPHVQRIPGPFQTGERNAGHCRADHAQCHQPGQHVFTADVDMYSFFHNKVIVAKKARFGNV